MHQNSIDFIEWFVSENQFLPVWETPDTLFLEKEAFVCEDMGHHKTVVNVLSGSYL